MKKTPPENVNTEPKRYFWMSLGALALVILTLVLSVFMYNLVPDDGMSHAYLVIIALILIFVALILSVFCLSKMRHKIVPLITILASAIPLFGFVCCGGGGLIMFYGMDFLQGNNPILAPKPILEWDSSPTAIIAQVGQPIKDSLVSIPPEYTRNYIPEARLWGDGRIVISSYSGSGDSRAVYEGRLTSEQISGFFKQAVDAGFFGWHDNYYSLLPYDNPSTTYLTINLLTAKKTVSSSMNSAPRAYNTLIKTLTSGEGANVGIFKPVQGTLIAIPTEEMATINWDTENLNLDLSKAAQGIPVEGKALQLAWDVVNKNPNYPPPISLNGVTYTIYVIIPGLMY